MMNEAMDLDPATQPQRARFEAVRRRVFDEMQIVAARWRLAMTVPFHILVIGLLASRGFPKDRLVLQVVAFLVCLAALTLAEKTQATKGVFFLGVSATGIVVAIANTGGLASPLLVSAVPLFIGVSMNPVIRRRRVFVAMFLGAFGGMACLSRSVMCRLAGPLEPTFAFASPEYVTISLAAVSVTLIAIYQIGKGITLAYERIALELAARREELCDENEGRTRALEGIAARLAHEVKNPLAAIKGLSAHMARNAEDPKVKERLSIVAAEAERLQEIVEGFLSFSRGLDELQVAQTRPYDIARELSLLLETRAADAGIVLEVRGSRELSLNADNKKLRQALLNLVLNAMQASSRGATVTLEVAKSCSDGAAVIRVMDRGAGMTADILDRIRKPYFTTKESGSGLGIAVARGIIEQHGGSLRFESSSGRGTTATVVLPACASVAQDKKQKLPNPCRMAAMIGEAALAGAKKPEVSGMGSPVLAAAPERKASS
jgi:signal transduction histidine kinase